MPCGGCLHTACTFYLHRFKKVALSTTDCLFKGLNCWEVSAEVAFALCFHAHTARSYETFCCIQPSSVICFKYHLNLPSKLSCPTVHTERLFVEMYCIYMSKLSSLSCFNLHVDCNQCHDLHFQGKSTRTKHFFTLTKHRLQLKDLTQ